MCCMGLVGFWFVGSYEAAYTCDAIELPIKAAEPCSWYNDIGVNKLGEQL